MTHAPVITTARLRLRPHDMGDLDAFWAFYQSPRAQYVGRPDNRTHLWYGLASEVGSWALMGHGGWAIDTRDGELVGQVAITRPPHFPETEIGWTLFDGHEGKGFAREAATAALRWAWTSGFDTLVSYIHPDNARSIALARRLGAAQDGEARKPKGDGDRGTLVFRHSADVASDADGNAEAYA